MTEKKRIYGTGNKHLVGNVWYVRYYDAAGIRRHESAGTDDEAKAERFLHKRKAQGARGLGLGTAGLRSQTEGVTNDPRENGPTKS